MMGGAPVRAAELFSKGDNLAAPEPEAAAGEAGAHCATAIRWRRDACGARGLPVGGTKAALRSRLGATQPQLRFLLEQVKGLGTW